MAERTSAVEIGIKTPADRMSAALLLERGSLLAMYRSSRWRLQFRLPEDALRRALAQIQIPAPAVDEGRVSGSITLGNRRLTLWCVIQPLSTKAYWFVSASKFNNNG